MVTFNCQNAKRSVDTLTELCQTSDVVALQETWLLPNEITFLSSIHPDFHFTGTSAMDPSAGILRGRQHGGVALMWRRSVFPNVSVIQCANPRVCAIKIVLSGKSFLVINVYMPTQKPKNLPEFTDCLSAVSAIIDNSDVSCVYFLGDFNADPSKPFYDELLSFCCDQSSVSEQTTRLI